MEHYLFRDNVLLTHYETLPTEATNVLFIAGIHGNEIGTIQLAYSLIKNFEEFSDYENIGIIGVIPCVNQSGLRNNTRNATEDYSDLNRGWKDNPRSDLLDVITEMERQYSTKFHIVVDMHCSPNIAPIFLLNRDQKYVSEIMDAIDESVHDLPSELSFSIRNRVFGCVRDTSISTFKRSYSNEKRIVLTYEQSGYGEALHSLNTEMVNYFASIFMTTLVPKLRNILTENKPSVNYDTNYLCKHIITNTEGLLCIYKNVFLGCIVRYGDAIAAIRDIRTDEIIETIRYLPNYDYAKQSSSDLNKEKGIVVELETSTGNDIYVTPGRIVAMIQPINHKGDK